MNTLALTWLVRLAGAAAVLAILWVAVVTPRLQLRDERAAHAETKSGHAAVLQDLAEKTAAVAIKVREREAQFALAASDSDATHAQEKADALAAKDRIIAGLRAGNLELRQWWQDRPVSCAADAAAEADPGADAERAELRAASAGRAIAAGAEADAWIGWLQRELTATRTACGVTP